MNSTTQDGLRQIPTPEGVKTYASEKNAIRAAHEVQVDCMIVLDCRFLVVPTPSRRWRVIFVLSSDGVKRAAGIGYLLGTGHQVIA